MRNVWENGKKILERYMAIFMSIVLIAGLSEGPGAVEVKAEVGKRNFGILYEIFSGAI